MSLSKSRIALAVPFARNIFVQLGRSDSRFQLTTDPKCFLSRVNDRAFTQLATRDRPETIITLEPTIKPN